MTQGYWIVLDGLGGELDREFRKSVQQAQFVAGAMASKMEPDDTLRIIEGESEQEEQE